MLRIVKSLKSDGQQFHLYQQNEHSHFTLTSGMEEMPWHMTLEIHVMAWDSHKHVVKLNRFL
jgi:hypothetical protein